MITACSLTLDQTFTVFFCTACANANLFGNVESPTDSQMQCFDDRAAEREQEVVTACGEMNTTDVRKLSLLYHKYNNQEFGFAFHTCSWLHFATVNPALKLCLRFTLHATTVV